MPRTPLPPADATARQSNGRASASADSHRDGASRHLRGIWAACQDAATQGATLGRIGLQDIQASARKKIMRLLIALGVGIIALAMMVTLAIWAVARTLTELCSAMGGGLLGCLGAIAIFVICAVATVLVTRLVQSRRRVARIRRSLDPESETSDKPASPPSPEQVELQRLREQAIADLHADKDKIVHHSGKLVERRPYAALGLGAASGFLSTRLLMAMPRGARRGAISVFRALKSAGLASLLGAAVQSTGKGEPR